MAKFRLSVLLALGAITLATAARSEPAPPYAASAWVKDLGRQLAVRLHNPRPIGASAEPEGVVDVRFKVGADGAPEAVEVLHSSRNRQLDHIGVKAVSRLRKLSPPPELGSGPTIVARILFVAGERQLDAGAEGRRLAAADALNLAAGRASRIQDVALAAKDR